MSLATDVASPESEREAASTTKMTPRRAGSDRWEREEERRSLPWPGVSMRMYLGGGLDESERAGSLAERYLFEPSGVEEGRWSVVRVEVCDVRVSGASGLDSEERRWSWLW